MKLFLTLILSATILTGNFPAEAKITDAVHRALEYLERNEHIIKRCLEVGGELKERPNNPKRLVCCKNGYDVSEYGGLYYLYSYPEVCGCPDGGTAVSAPSASSGIVRFFDGKICCKNSLAYMDSGSPGYTMAEPGCGCPDGGTPSQNGKTCCKNGLSWHPVLQKYFYKSLNCNSCPDGGTIFYEKDGNSVRKVCCKDGYSYGEITGRYNGFRPKYCGCPDGFEVVDGERDGTCCPSDAVQINFEGKKVCDCPAGTEFLKGECCPVDKIQLIGGEKYCGGCPDYTEYIDGKCCHKYNIKELPDGKKVCGCPYEWLETNGKCCPTDMRLNLKEEWVCDGCKKDDEECNCQMEGKYWDISAKVCCSKGERKKVFFAGSFFSGYCVCPEDTEEINGVCCPKDALVTNADGKKVCGKCLLGEELMTDYDGNYHCCPEGKDFWSGKEKRCCEALDLDGKCCPANKVIIGSDAMKICDTCSSEETLFRANDGTSHCCPVGSIWIDE